MSVHGGPAKWWTAGTSTGKEHVAKKGIEQNGLILNLDAGVTASYPGSGNTWTDLKSGIVNPILYNGTAYNFSNGGSLVFDGTNDYLETNFTEILNDCSIEILFRSTSTKIYQYLLSISNLSNTSYSLQFDMNDSDSNFAQTMWVFWNSGGTPNSVIPKTGTFGDWNDSNWRHYTFTRSVTVSPYTKHYMNGVEVANVTRNGDQTTQFGNGAGYKLRIGNYWSGSFGYYVGNIASIRIYNRVLTSAEIRKNFNAIRGRFGI